MKTYTEMSLPDGDTPRRPDGTISVERAGKLWVSVGSTRGNAESGFIRSADEAVDRFHATEVAARLVPADRAARARRHDAVVDAIDVLTTDIGL